MHAATFRTKPLTLGGEGPRTRPVPKHAGCHCAGCWGAVDAHSPSPLREEHAALQTPALSMSSFTEELLTPPAAVVWHQVEVQGFVPHMLCLDPSALLGKVFKLSEPQFPICEMEARAEPPPPTPPHTAESHHALWSMAPLVWDTGQHVAESR